MFGWLLRQELSVLLVPRLIARFTLPMLLAGSRLLSVIVPSPSAKLPGPVAVVLQPDVLPPLGFA